LKKVMLLAALLAMVIVAAVPAIAQVSQSTEQEAQSGDATQNFNVTGGGDNSNACQGVQGITNTGNATNNTSVLQYANDGRHGAEFEQDNSGDLTISPSSTTTCTQQVNQAASASGH
jgi:maltose-binding protein MalE